MDYEISKYTWTPFDWREDKFPRCIECQLIKLHFRKVYHVCNRCVALGCGNKRNYFQSKEDTP